MRLRLMQKVRLQMPLFVLPLPARLLFELSKGLSSAAAVVPPPQRVIHESKEQNHFQRKQQPLEEQFECCLIAKMSLEDEETENDDHESDLGERLG